MMKNEIQKLTTELKDTRKKFRTTLQVNLSKDLRIQKLENILTKNSIQFSSEYLYSEQFASFKKYFTEHELAGLRGLDFDKSSDSTFLRSCINALYAQNLSTIEFRTVTGTKEREKTVMGKRVLIPAREEITPEKMNILSSIFDERIEAIPNIDQLEKSKRVKNMRIVLAKVLDRIRVDHLDSPRAKRRLELQM